MEHAEIFEHHYTVTELAEFRSTRPTCRTPA
jgi:hypothetical protein